MASICRRFRFFCRGDVDPGKMWDQKNRFYCSHGSPYGSGSCLCMDFGYEYKEITADMGQISFLIDGYENFGWEVDENVAQPALETFPKRAGAMQHKKAVLRLKRDRKIINKTELTRLGLPAGGLDFLVRGIGAGVPDIVPDGIVKEKYILVYHRDLFQYTLCGHMVNRFAAD